MEHRIIYGEPIIKQNRRKMKAVIQFEIPDNKKPDKENQDKLVKAIADLIEDWLKGDAAIYIDFIKTYESNEETTFGNWVTTTTND